MIILLVAAQPVPRWGNVQQRKKQGQRPQRADVGFLGDHQGVLNICQYLVQLPQGIGDCHQPLRKFYNALYWLIKMTVAIFTLQTESGYHLLQLGTVPPIIYGSVCG